MSLSKRIDPKAAKLLEGRPVKPQAANVLRWVLPTRQVAMAKLMVSMENYTEVFARVLLMSTPRNQLVKGNVEKELTGIASDEIAQMEAEMTSLERDFNELNGHYCQNMLELSVIQGYVRRLLRNQDIGRFLKSRYPEMYLEIEAAVAKGGL